MRSCFIRGQCASSSGPVGAQSPLSPPLLLWLCLKSEGRGEQKVGIGRMGGGWGEEHRRRHFIAMAEIPRSAKATTGSNPEFLACHAKVEILPIGGQILCLFLPLIVNKQPIVFYPLIIYSFNEGQARV